MGWKLEEIECEHFTVAAYRQATIHVNLLQDRLDA